MKDFIKAILTSLLCSLVLLQTFPKSLVVLDYFVNTAKYEALCINKTHPEMHCDGACQMDKKLQKIDHSQQHQPQSERTETSVVYLPSVDSFQQFIFLSPIPKNNYPPLLQNKPRRRPLSIFKPPQLFS